jgi:anti-sigma factor RsiW
MKTMDCHHAQPLLSAYGDGELELGQALLLEDHLAQCGACTAELDRQRALSLDLRRRMPYHAASPALAARLRSALATETGAMPVAAASATATRPIPKPTKPLRRSMTPWARWAMPMAAALVLAVGLNGALLQRQRGERLADEVVASHVRSLMADHLNDVVSSDHHTVKPWFAGRLDFSPPVRDFAEAGYALAGGRLDYVGGRAVAALDYRHGLHIINLFVWPSRDAAADTGSSAEVRAGYNVEHWRRNGMEFWAVSDLNAEEMSRFAQLQQSPSAAGG